MKQVWKIRFKRTGNFHSEEYPSEKAAEEALDHSIAAGFWREYIEVVKYDVELPEEGYTSEGGPNYEGS